MATWPTAVTGDVDDFCDRSLSGITDLLAATSVEAHVKDGDGDDTFTVLTCTIPDANTTIVRVQYGDGAGWLATLDLAPGLIKRYKVEIEVTWNTGSVQTWSPDVLPVRGQYDQS